MKKFLKILTLLFILTSSLCLLVQASEKDEMNIIINDGFVNSSTKTSIINGLDYIPLSRLQDNLGIKVYYKEDDGGYYIYWWNNCLYMNKEKNIVIVNNERRILENQMEIIDDALFVSSDVLVNIFGFKIEKIDSINSFRIITRDDVKSIQDIIKIKEEKDKAQLINKKPAVKTYDGPKVAYITFDDGIVRNNTIKILDILKEKDVKATFFILGNTISKNQDILKRIKEEGHSIGNHSYSHKKEEIYKSSTALFNEIQKTSDLIKETLGDVMNLFRPPYGSSKIKEKAYQEVLKGYKIVLWNVDSNDSRIKDIKAEQIYNNVVDQVKNKKNAIILFHETKSESVKALPMVIDYLRESGFEIKPITEETLISYK